MKVILFGATGMVGQGVLRECLLDPMVEMVLAVGRNATGTEHPKFRELVHADLFDWSTDAEALSSFDACFFCLGVSSAGMNEQAYRKVTYDLTMAIARTVLAQSPSATFIFVSGGGTDSTAKGRSMWARVKGETENALLAMPFRAKYMFRPAFIQPLHGVTSRTTLYRIIYAVMGPLYPLWRAIAPKYVTTTERVGRAMLVVAQKGASKGVLENDEIDALGAPESS